MNEQNKQRAAELAKYGLQIDMAYAAEAKIESLVEILVEQKVFQLEELENKVDEKIGALLERAEEELNKARLLAALQMLPEEEEETEDE